MKQVVQGTVETKHCNFWLPNKNRFCANCPLEGSLFCGNHNSRPQGQWVPCPIDPSHSVLEQNLNGHVKRCPLLKQVQSLSVQPFYQKGINAGSDGEEETSRVDDSRLPTMTVSSEMKRNALHKMSVPEFCNLIEKIESLHDSLCKDIQNSIQMPEVCSLWIKSRIEDRKLPFQEKHIVQQASILGNLENFGLLKPSLGRKPSEREEQVQEKEGVVPAVIEFGAGRGYLTQMLADCYGIKKVFLVERKSYKLKADRSLRQNESLMLERLRIDNSDEKPVMGFIYEEMDWAKERIEEAFGRVKKSYMPLWEIIDERWDNQLYMLLHAAVEDLDLNAVESLQRAPFLAIGKHLCGAATDLTLRCCFPEFRKDSSEQYTANNMFGGLALATCCHHLCQWTHYTNKRFFLDLGFTKEEFHAITWFTSWAVDAIHDSDLPDTTTCRSHLQSIKEQGDGYANGVEKILSDMEANKRAALGFKCKWIIDMGRLMWLGQHGLNAKLVRYVPPSISPENHLLIARPSK